MSHVDIVELFLGIWCSPLGQRSGLIKALTALSLIFSGGLIHSKQVKSAYLNCLLLDLRRELSFIFHLCSELN